VIDAALHDRAQCSVLQGDGSDWPWSSRQIDRQHFQREAIGIEAEEGDREGGEKRTRRKQIGAEVQGIGGHECLRHGDPPRLEGFPQNHVGPGVGWRQKPVFVHQFGEIDSAAAPPLALRSSHHGQFIMEKDLHIQVFVLICRWSGYSRQDHVEAALAQFWQFQRWGNDL